MTNPKNLPKTCGQCHPGAGERFALGPMHVKEGGAGEHPSVRWARLFYLLVIPGTIGFMLLHNLGDWLRKLQAMQRGARFERLLPQQGEIRMYRWEQMTHAVLAISFIVLAWSGFALKYPGSWWAGPLSEAVIRRNVHRVAAVAMMVATFMHLFSILGNKFLREHWKEFIPKARDISDAMQYMLYAMNLRKERPVLPPHSYIEKAEYWAVVWGTIVMVATGGLLWANTASLRLLPHWLLDLSTAVHWYEAVLASLAIVVWHFYSVIFDPEVYPMDTAWLTGRSVKHKDHEAHQHGD
jgi:cytochrome b subunit of formate dehydrogenase